MRPGWLKKEVGAAMPIAIPQSPVSAKISELTSSRSNPKALSRPRIRELLTCAMIRLMERMIAELFPCANDTDASATFGRDSGASGPLPSFEEFLKHICRRTRTPLTCMCLALLYLTRLRANHPRSRGSPGSSYRLALSSLCVATKYLYDDAYHTCSWVQVSMGLFSQREVNQMEMEFMYFLHYQLGVTPTEWNQWIATLEAKLVARWQETGKAETIYNFGLFLSYECCDGESQEAVRDVAWGDGGRSLLELLHNAIHLPRVADPAKCSPSADSAVSDTTCLPTPDPNSWFRMRSPAPSGLSQGAAELSGVTTASAPSASITPTTAQFSDVPGISEDYSASGLHQPSSSYVRHSYIENRSASPGTQRFATVASSSGTLTHHGSAPFGLRPSSVCSVPNASYASGAAGGVARSSHKSYKFAPTSRSLQRQKSELSEYEWRHHSVSLSHSPAHQLVPQMSTESMIPSYSQSSKGAKANAPSFERLAVGTASIAPSQSSESRESGGLHAQRMHGQSTRIPLSTIAAQTHSIYGTGPRSTSVQRGAMMGVGGYSEVSYDRPSQNGPSSLHRAGTMPVVQLQGAASSRGQRIDGHAMVELGEVGAPSHGRQQGSAGASSRGNASIKSSSSSLRASSRRHSWRHSSRNHLSFTQKLRSLAGFGWSSTSSRSDDIKERGADIMQYGADDSGSSPFGNGSYGNLETQPQTLTNASGFAARAASDSRRGSSHVMQPSSAVHMGDSGSYSSRGSGGVHVGYEASSRRLAGMAGQRAPLSSSSHKSEHNYLSDSYRLDVDPAKYVSTRS
ncbi:hypothetical protein H4R22_000733 [Coemansia sp. RSA 1290]|nr:hypothetical protein H4R22_000733 [Coemansia sp. RSA 1290]KAJ2650354.1 hypothetical protein IWW40_002531 [Coemansia sp. RSA 1250]